MRKIVIITLLVVGLSSPVYSEQATENKQNSDSTSSSTSTGAAETAQSHMDKGSAFWAESKLDLAEAEFNKAIKKDSKSAQAHARLAGLLLMQNKTAKAVPIYQKAISLDPKNPKLFAALSIAYLHQAKFGMAKVMANEALRIDPKLDKIKKINEYIEMKQKMLAKTKENAAQHHMPPHGAVKGVVKKEETGQKEEENKAEKNK